MTQTNNLPATQEINQENFGALVKLPDVLTENRTRALNAKNATLTITDKLVKVDLQTVDATEFEKEMVIVSNLRTKLAATLTHLNDNRTPYTSTMNEIISLFTAEEATVKNCINSIKAIADSWEKEKAKRAADAAKKLAEEIERKNQEIELRTHIKTFFSNSFSKALLETINKLNSTYNSKKVDELGAYGEQLKVWNPDFNKFPFNKVYGIRTSIFTQEESKKIADEILNVLLPEFTATYTSALQNEVERLIQLIPSRIDALIRNAEAENKRVADENLQRQKDFEAEQLRLSEQAKTQAEADKMNTVFEVASTAAPVAEKAKGTVIKKVYAATSHAAWIALIQSFIANDFPGMSLTDIEKKFGFALTAANKRLSTGEEIKASGLKVDEDFSTRTNSRK